MIIMKLFRKYDKHTLGFVLSAVVTVFVWVYCTIGFQTHMRINVWIRATLASVSNGLSLGLKPTLLRNTCSVPLPSAIGEHSTFRLELFLLETFLGLRSKDGQIILLFFGPNALY
jgi:hypothetical protein